MLGWPGALIALIAISLPSAAIAVLLTYLYEIWSYHPLAAVAMRGILAATIGTIAASAWVLIRPSLKSGQWFRAGLLVTGAFALNRWLSLSPLQVLGLAALVGLLLPTNRK